MPYDRDQVIAAVTDYYNFLTRLHLDSEDIRRPPPEGWSQISEKRLSPLNKSEEVISLLKHLPYVQNDENFSPFLVWTLSGCNDYTGWDFQKAIEGGSTSSMMPEDIETAPEDCTWEKLHKPYPHTIPLASPAVGCAWNHPC